MLKAQQHTNKTYHNRKNSAKIKISWVLFCKCRQYEQNAKYDMHTAFTFLSNLGLNTHPHKLVFRQTQHN